MKRLILPKIFVNHPEKAFSDDGNYFRVLYYKDKLPISVLHDSVDEQTYLDIRLDYLGMPYQTYMEDNKLLGEFNGVADSEFNIEKLIANCEYILDKYIENPEVVEPAKPETTAKEVFEKLAAIAKEFGFAAEMEHTEGYTPYFRIKDSEGIVKFYVTTLADWANWKTTRLVKRTLNVKVESVRRVWGYPSVGELTLNAEKYLAAAKLLERLEKEKLSFEEVHIN